MTSRMVELADVADALAAAMAMVVTPRPEMLRELSDALNRMPEHVHIALMELWIEQAEGGA